MAEYLQTMFDSALRKEPQAIHFWCTVYAVFVLCGSLWHALRVRAWPHTQGRLLGLGVRAFGGPEHHAADQQFVPHAVYEYQVDGQFYQGSEISIWKISASGILKGAAALPAKLVGGDTPGEVRVYYHPRKPRRSVVLRPGWMSLLWLSAAIVLVAGCYIWRW